ncbi:MAG: biotin/lipoyl-binding protein [Clostridiales bacterium]|nr:biotin/lipoyl-binding protein [Clostridiales bacterium]
MNQQEKSRRKNWKQILNFELDKEKKASLQVRALRWLAAFLILMILLTLLSRAADSVTVAKVTTTGVSGGSLTHEIQAEGSISANREVSVEVASGLKIASVEAAAGTSVEEGDILLYLDTEDLNEKLESAQEELAVLEAQASDKEANDAIASAGAQKSLSRAQEDYDTAVSSANQSVADAKEEMEEALNAYNTLKNSGSSDGDTDTIVLDSLVKAVEEKQAAYDTAVTELENLNSEIEYTVNQKISGEGASTDAEKKSARDSVESEYKEKLTAAEKAVSTAKSDLDEADAALSAYQAESEAANQTDYEEQLQTLYEEYIAKKDAYNDALTAQEESVRSAKRALEDASESTDTVDTASELTEANAMEEKQEEVDALQELVDLGGEVTSPSDGLVVSVPVSAGETTAEETSIRIADQSAGYKFTVSLDKSTAKYLSAGDEITLDIGNDTTVSGLTIDSIEVSAEDSSTYNLTVFIPAKVTGLGNFASMSIEKTTKKYDCCVPLSALHSDGGDYFVYVLTESDTVLGTQTTVEQVQVEILDKNSESAAIEGGVGWGQEIVLTSTKSLRSGDRVRVEE